MVQTLLQGDFQMTAKTFLGLENVLAEELRQIGARDIKPVNRAVTFKGDKHLLYKSNLWLRTALNVLVPFAGFTAISENELYEKAKKIEWHKILDVNSTFAITNTVYSPYFKHSKFAALRVKDAIADNIRERTGKRPSVDVESPDIKIHLHISEDTCSLSLDSSGEPLFKRGYRREMHEAPINEILAAGIIQLTGWDKKQTFVDPMCGSGTFLTEAGMMACNMAPGSNRQFAFMKWKDFDNELWEELLNESSQAQINPRPALIGADRSERFIVMAKENIHLAGLPNQIEVQRATFETFEPPKGGGIVVMNPPYGQRMKEAEINEFYRRIGDRLKQAYAGYDVWLISSNMEALKHVGLRPSKKIRLFNGPLECKLHKYSIIEGSMKKTKTSIAM